MIVVTKSNTEMQKMISGGWKILRTFKTQKNIFAVVLRKVFEYAGQMYNKTKTVYVNPRIFPSSIPLKNNKNKKPRGGKPAWAR